MSTLILAWTYILKLLLGWWGLVLALLGFLDFFDWFRKKPLLLGRRYKFGLALALLFLTQFFAYQELNDELALKTNELNTALRRNSELETTLGEKDARITSLERELGAKNSQPVSSKRPVLYLLYKNKPLDGQTIELPMDDNRF
jgi:hypothetical protein